MKNNSIVENIKKTKQAKFRKRKHGLKLTDKEVETLALAWCSGEISYGDFINAIGVKGNGYGYLAIALRGYVNSR